MPSLLFVCVENSCRSQMAEAFAKMLAEPGVEAYSSGSRPSGVVNPKAIASMAEAGYELGNHVSKSLQQVPDIEYDYVVTMGCGDECPSIKAKQRLDWQIPDPKHMDEKDFAQVRDTIRHKVEELINNI